MTGSLPRVLLVTGRYPWPARQGDCLRATQQIRFLAGRADVTLLCPAPPPQAPGPGPDEPCSMVFYGPARSGPARIAGALGAAVRGLPAQSGLFQHPELGRTLRRLAPSMDCVVLQLVRLAGHLKDLPSGPERPRLVVDLIDCLSLNFARRAALDRAWLAPLWRFEAGRVEVWERRLVGLADRALLVCERDRRHLADRLGQAGEKLAVAPLAQPAPAARSARPESPDEAPTLILTGNLGYFVNREAATWWLSTVWPKIRHRRPDVRCVLAGARPSRSLTRLASGAGAELIASPPDLRAILRRGTLAIAPMRAGSGCPIKVLEAWEERVPVVASEWAAAGTAGVAGRDLAVASDPESWVETVSRLLEDPAERGRLAVSGRECLEREYSWGTARERFLGQVFGRALGDADRPSTS